LTLSSDEIFARMAITHVEFYNCIYDITSSFIDFQYALAETAANVSTYLTLTLTDILSTAYTLRN
jgi:hypothetical protein